MKSIRTKIANVFRWLAIKIADEPTTLYIPLHPERHIPNFEEIEYEPTTIKSAYRISRMELELAPTPGRLIEGVREDIRAALANAVAESPAIEIEETTDPFTDGILLMGKVRVLVRKGGAE